MISVSSLQCTKLQFDNFNLQQYDAVVIHQYDGRSGFCENSSVLSTKDIWSAYLDQSVNANPNQFFGHVCTSALKKAGFLNWICQITLLIQPLLSNNPSVISRVEKNCLVQSSVEPPQNGAKLHQCTCTILWPSGWMPWEKSDGLESVSLEMFLGTNHQVHSTVQTLGGLHKIVGSVQTTCNHLPICCQPQCGGKLTVWESMED